MPNPAFLLPLIMGGAQAGMGLFGKQGQLNTIGNTSIMKELLPLVKNQAQQGLSTGQEMMLRNNLDQGNSAVFNSQMALAKTTQGPLSARAAILDDAADNLYGANQNAAQTVAAADQNASQAGMGVLAELSRLIAQSQVDAKNQFDTNRGNMVGSGANLIMQALNSMFPVQQ